MSSTAEFRASKVREACEEWLKHREDYIKAERQACIASEMKPQWWRKAISAEKALKNIKADNWHSYHFASWYGSSELTPVKELLSLAQCSITSFASDSYVRVSSRDAHILRDYLG